MNHYMVFLNTGETIHVWADDFNWKNIGNLIFEKGSRNVAVFNTNNICGMMQCKEDNDG